jgi:hypothetical protein
VSIDSLGTRTDAKVAAMVKDGTLSVDMFPTDMAAGDSRPATNGLATAFSSDTLHGGSAFHQEGTGRGTAGKLFFAWAVSDAKVNADLFEADFATQVTRRFVIQEQYRLKTASLEELRTAYQADVDAMWPDVNLEADMRIRQPGFVVHTKKKGGFRVSVARR